MTQNEKKWIRLIFFGAISAALATAAILLIIQCVAIYRLGDSPFTRERVAEYFAPISIPVYVCLGLVAAGVALSPLLPAAPDSAPDRDAVTLRRLQTQVDLSACDAGVAYTVRSLRQRRTLHHHVTLCLLAVGSVVFLWYALDVSRFSTEDINSSMIKAVLLLLPCMGIPALYAVFAAYQCRSSVRGEIVVLRQAMRMFFAARQQNNGGATNLKEITFASRKVTDDKWLPYVQSAILVLGVALVTVGLMENGAAAVLTKAINICTECIGLG